MLKSVAVSCHVNDFAMVDEPVQDGGCNRRVAQELGPFVKALDGCNNQRGSLRHGGDKAKEQVCLPRGERHEAHLVYYNQRSLPHILDSLLCAFNSAFLPNSNPLNLQQIVSEKSVWVEPISTDRALAEKLRGVYHLKGAVVENEFGQRFYLDNLGKDWVAFRTLPLKSNQ